MNLSAQMVDFLKSRGNFVERLLHHLGVSAIMDILLRLITCIESVECRNDCVKVRLDNFICPLSTVTAMKITLVYAAISIVFLTTELVTKKWHNML